ncbi:hypothetical protein Q757_06985 [Oenococcus alcoholitolerans]|uniref:Uncharacterized protein n=1 Tax=Oenococcus alcoholitolerans TaxID=931074 RepID=A0ABR4XQ65_9LACO|nr:hypothetical protein Q757_06985 [Oenococcus alcoholitolerans]
MKRVTWLNADQTSRDTMSVILTSVFFSAFFDLCRLDLFDADPFLDKWLIIL